MTANALIREAVLGGISASRGSITPRYDDEWVMLVAPLGLQEAPLTPWDALLLNAKSAGQAKLVLPSGGGAIEIRAELPASDEPRLADRVRRACREMQQLGAMAAGADAAGEAGTSSRQSSEEGLAPEGSDLAAIAAEGGWNSIPRSNGRLAFDLETPGQFQQAVIGPHGGDLRALATLAVVRGLSARSRRASAELLLAVAGIVRLVRAGAVEDQDEATLFFEVSLCGAPTAGDVDEALSALAVGCRMAGREVKALADAEVARTYLAARDRDAQ